MRLPICLAILLSTAVLASNTPAVAAAEAKLRVWTSASGGFSIKGTFVELKTKADGSLVVVIKKENGKIIPVVLDKLSAADRKYVESLQEDGADADDGDAATESDADSSEERGPAIRLTQRGLSRDGDVWVLQDEVQLDELHTKAQGYSNSLKEAKSAINASRRIQAHKATRELARRERDLKNYQAIYKKVFVTSEQQTREASLEKFKNAVKQTFGDVYSADADAANVKRSLIEVLRQIDTRIASAEIKYQALRQDPKVLAAITELGGSLGPRESFVRLKTEFNTLANPYLASSEFLSRGADVMDCGISPTSDGLPSAQDEAEAFLTAIGVEARKEVWSPLCEANMISDVKEAGDLATQQAKVAKARREFDGAMAKIDAQNPDRRDPRLRQGPLAGTHARQRKQQGFGQLDTGTSRTPLVLNKFLPWASKKLALMAKAEKIEGPESRILKAKIEFDRLKEEQRLLLGRAQEKAKRIRAHCESLSQDASVKTALEKVSGTLQPSANFEQHLRKAKSLQKKLAGKK